VNESLPPADNIRFRAFAVGVFLAVCICAITPYNNAFLQATPLGGGHFPLAPFVILVWMTLLAALLNFFFRDRMPLTGREILFAWILMVLVSGIAYTGLIRTFFINLTAPFHFATVENRWEETIQPFLPHAWYPQNADAVQMLYDGLPGGRQMSWKDVLFQIPWLAWIGPLTVWSAFVFLCYATMIFIVNIVSRQWLQHERMNMPLLQVPQMIEEALDQHQLTRFFTNRYVFTGILIPVLLHLLNGLNFYFPSIPQIPTLILAGPYIPSQGIFSGFVKLKIYIYPAFIGLAFLTSKQISFSFWFFYLIGGLLIGALGMLGYNIPDAALGITFGPTLARPEETQMLGAYGIFFICLVWLGRQHLKEVFRQAFSLSAYTRTADEWISLRTSFWGLVVCFFSLIAWCHYFGMHLGVAILFLLACFMVMIVATRVICQGGIAYFTLTAAPIDGLTAFFGPRLFSGIGILMAAVIQKVLFVDLRESLMPSLLHAGKITQRLSRQRLIIAGIGFVLIIGVCISFLSMLFLCYRYGIRELELDWATRTTLGVYDNIQSYMNTPPSRSNWVLVFSLTGAAVMTALVICYHRIYWWPIHPIGYLTAYSSAMRILWFSFFLGWICNALCMRYGGVSLFKKLRYFFIGLIIGDFLMGGFWAMIGLWGNTSYLVLPD
jgi:hypothetical protein